MECPKCHAENREDSHFCSNCATPLAQLGAGQASLTKTLETTVHVLKAGGLIAGKYRILEEIGRGGMGIVYKVEDTQLKRTAALKFLSPDSTAIPSREKRFAQEAQTASALNHPNICTIYEVGEAEGNSYIAMEYVEGRSLDRMIPPGGLPPEDVLRFGGQIVEALEHAHERSVIHRDLKSANVVITPAGRVKVLDFGLAKRLIPGELGEAMRSQLSLTEEGVIAGTLPYLAPETLQGNPADARSDIWALGVVLYEMAAGTRPFQGRTGFELTSSILRDMPATVPERTPAGLRAVIQKCLEKDVEKRFQTVSEVRAVLETNVFVRSSRAFGGSSNIRNRRGLWILAGVVVLGIAGALIFKLTPRGGEKLEGTKDLPVLSTGARPSPIAEANEYFERAMFFARAQFNLTRARKMLERALEIDPRFAEARAWLGFGYIIEIDAGYSNDSSWLYKAEQELRRALQDDPDSARSHSALEALYFYQGRKDLIPEEAQKALSLNPNEIDAKIWLSNYYLMNGEYAPAKELLNQVLKDDPLFFPARMNLGDILRLEGDIDGTIRENGKILEQDPRNIYGVLGIARAYIDGNNLPAARRSLESVSPDEQRGFAFKLKWTLVLALEGKTKEAVETLDEESLKYGALAPYTTSEVAEFYAIMGDSQKSLDWLERAVRNGDERDAWFRRDPLLAKIRDLPRFQQIIDSIEFRRKSRL
jgi:serine/threonine protein kinase/tetratricopeptide (TPR) repeat protein